MLALLALVLRAWGLDYGFPQPWTRPDEARWVRIALGLLEDPNPRWFHWPTLHAYLLAVLYWAWGHVRLWRGDFPSWHAYLNEPAEVFLSDLVLLGRMLSVLVGTLVIPVAWRLGERTGPRGTGLLAAAFVAVSFGAVRDAHWALTDAPLLLGIALTLLLSLRALDRATLASFARAGLAAGLTTGTKYSGLTVVAPIVAAALLARRVEGRSVVGTVWDRRLLVAGAATIAGFLAASPFMLVSRREFMAAMAIREWHYRDASFGTDIGFVHHLLFSLRYGQGVLLELAGIAGLVLLGWRTGPRAVIAVYALATYAAIGGARAVPMRYASTLVPAVALGAAWAVMAVSARWRRAGIIAGVATAAICAEPLYRSVRFDRLLAREDTRVTARAWLDARLPPLARITVPESKTLRWGRPLLEDRYTVVPYHPRVLRRHEAEWLLLPESPTGHAPFSPELHEQARSAGTLVALFDPFGPHARPVYDPHDAFFVPVAGFAGVRVPGPRITIYDLGNAGDRRGGTLGEDNGSPRPGHRGVAGQEESP